MELVRRIGASLESGINAYHSPWAGTTGRLEGMPMNLNSRW